MNDLLSNVLIQPKVLTPEAIDFLINHAENSDQEQMGVFDPERANQKPDEIHPGKIDLSSRNVKCADIIPILSEIKELYDNIVHNVINPFYGFKIRDSELPQLLVYKPGGHYQPHYDAVAKWKCPDGNIIWKKSIDRDISTVLFLNNDFEGGDFVFPDLRVTIRPEPGLLVAFPSSQFYLHKVEPVISGTRYTMVNWMTVQGFKTKVEIDKELSDKYGVKVV
jgi:Rps23 Pro-64 3,4-dihydroxylase Tpa1-like proline 4-hydroxylase